MVVSATDANLSPKQVMESYRRAYRSVHNREPHIHHLFDVWYEVNGETVHRLTLFREITRLRDLAQKQKQVTVDRKLVQRLIAKLRGL